MALFDNVAPNATFDSQFYASTTELFSFGLQAVNGTGMELWFNLEAFEQTLATLPCHGTTLGRTNKARLDRSMTMAGSSPSKKICSHATRNICLAVNNWMGVLIQELEGV